jgi:hypothetical protein
VRSFSFKGLRLPLALAMVISVNWQIDIRLLMAQDNCAFVIRVPFLDLSIKVLKFK